MDTSIFEASFNPNFYLGHMKYRMFFPVCVHHISCQNRRSKSFWVKREKDVGNESINILFCKHNFSLDSFTVSFLGKCINSSSRRKQDKHLDVVSLEPTPLSFDKALYKTIRFWVTWNYHTIISLMKWQALQHIQYPICCIRKFWEQLFKWTLSRFFYFFGSVLSKRNLLTWVKSY